MKKIVLASITGLVAFSIVNQAQAEMSAPMGWYAEANAGSTHLSDRNYNGSSSSNGLGGNLNIGYKFMPYFAAEVGYTRYANTSVKDPSTDTRAGTDKHYSYDIAGKAILPLGSTGFEAFAKLGAAAVRSSFGISNATAASNIGMGSQSHSATGVYMAVGAQYYFMPELALNVQWAQANGSSSTGHPALLSAGLSFIFA